MPLGTEVGLGPGEIVLHGDPVPPRKGAVFQPTKGLCQVFIGNETIRKLLKLLSDQFSWEYCIYFSMGLKSMVVLMLLKDNVALHSFSFSVHSVK